MFDEKHTWLLLLLATSTTIANALVCYDCKHANARAATRHLADRIEASAASCRERRVCEGWRADARRIATFKSHSLGEWCVAQLSADANVTFTCADQTPLDFYWPKKSDRVLSHCQATFNGDSSIAFATCWCRDASYCHSATFDSTAAHAVADGSSLLISILVVLCVPNIL